MQFNCETNDGDFIVIERVGEKSISLDIKDNTGFCLGTVQLDIYTAIKFQKTVSNIIREIKEVDNV